MAEQMDENNNIGTEKASENHQENQAGKIKKNENVSAEIQTIIDKIQEFKQEAIQFLMGNISDPMLSPLASKITGEHIHKMLEIDEKSDEREFENIRHARKYQLFYILLAVLLFVFLSVFLVEKDKELFKETIKLFIAFVGGLGAGFGIKSHLDKK